MDMATPSSPPQPNDTTLQVRRIDPHVHHEMRIEAASLTMTMHELVERMWDTYLTDKSRSNGHKR